MARIPLYQDYAKRQNFQDGIRRCNELLEKTPEDAQLLATKFQLLLATNEDEAPTLDRIAALPHKDLNIVLQIEAATVRSLEDVFPRPTTAGPTLSKLWDQAIKDIKATGAKHDTIGMRYVKAVKDNRLADAQQALIQLKTLFPKDRSLYMAHAAFTQLLSISKDDLQSRLALMLAKKAVSENFDDDKDLDCRVPGQIFAIQGCQEELEKIKSRTFAKSKQVSDALRSSNGTTNGNSHVPPDVDPASASTSDWFSSEVQKLGKEFSGLLPLGFDAMKLFASNAVRLFHTGLTSLLGVRQRLITETCFLAMSALIRLFEKSSQHTYLLQAAYLSERLLQHNPHIHEAKLALIYLYMQLGLATLAVKQFESLNVREVQLDTIAHVLFARLGSTYPHGVSISKRDTFDPLKRMGTALLVYSRYEDRLTKTLEDIIHHGQTGMIFDLQELRDNMRDSFSRRQTLLEHRRIARMTRRETQIPSFGPRVTANWVTTIDNRDFDECFNFGYNVEKVLHSPIPSKTNLLHGLVADTLWSLAVGHEPLIKDTPILLQTLETNLSSKSDGLHFGLSSAERITGTILVHALSLYQDISHPESSTEAKSNSADLLLKSLQSIPFNVVSSAQDLLAKTLPDHYVFLDVLKVLAAFVKKFAKDIPIHATIDDTIMAASRALHKNAKNQKNNITPTTIKDMITEDVAADTWKSSLNTFPGPDLPGFCDEAAKSAREGWDGVSRVEVP